MSHVPCVMQKFKHALSSSMRNACVSLCVYGFLVVVFAFTHRTLSNSVSNHSEIHEHAKHPSIARFMNTLPVVKPDNILHAINIAEQIYQNCIPVYVDFGK